ncbi:MAG: NTP transferase domain-containing protein [Bryobacterales bacterium]|nr:NTP transferase domain-containing protein [Bryobacterales bacterium]
MTTVILAGGLGMRLRPFTAVLPKPLLPLGERSLLEHQIARLKSFGCDEVIVATNYKSDLVEAVLRDGAHLGVRVTISRETIPLGTAGPLKLLEGKLRDPFLVVNGDILTALDFRRFFERGRANSARLTVATKVVSAPFRFSHVRCGPDDTLRDVTEKPDFQLEVLAGIYCLHPSLLSLIPPGAYFGMDQLIRRCLEVGEPVKRHLVQEYWLDIGQIEDYTKARAAFEDRTLELAG